MKFAINILLCFNVLVVAGCGKQSATTKTTIDEFIAQNLYNWTWCYPVDTSNWTNESHRRYTLRNEGYLKTLNADVFSVNTFCHEGGSFICLAPKSMHYDDYVLIPMTMYDATNGSIYYWRSSQENCFVPDFHLNEDFFSLEQYLNKHGDTSLINLKSDMYELFALYLSVKYQIKLTDIQENINTPQKNAFGLVFDHDLRKDKIIKDNLLCSFVCNLQTGYHIFLLRRSSDFSFNKQNPFRVQYLILWP